MDGGGPDGAILGGMMRGMLGAGGRGGGSVEEKDNTDWIFSIPEVCVLSQALFT